MKCWPSACICFANHYNNIRQLDLKACQREATRAASQKWRRKGTISFGESSPSSVPYGDERLAKSINAKDKPRGEVRSTEGGSVDHRRVYSTFQLACQHYPIGSSFLLSRFLRGAAFPFKNMVLFV